MNRPVFEAACEEASAWSRSQVMFFDILDTYREAKPCRVSRRRRSVLPG